MERSGRMAGLAVAVLVACGDGRVVTPSHPVAAPSASPERVRSEVRAYLEGVAEDVTHDGPQAWRRHFDPADAFVVEGFMLMAPANRLELNGFAFNQRIEHVSLHWTKIVIDPLGADLAAFAAEYAEKYELVGEHHGGAQGTLTGIARRDGNRWWLRDVHWSEGTVWAEPVSPG